MSISIVSNFEGANFLYHNNHDLTFTEVGQAGRRAGAVLQLRDVVLRLRQRWLAGPVCDQLLQLTDGSGDS